MSSLQDLTEHTQLQEQYSQTSVVLWGNIVIGGLTGLYYFNKIDSGFIAVWYAFLLGIAAARYILYRAYQKSDVIADNIQNWLLAYTLGSFFTGVCWAVLGVSLVLILDSSSLFILFLALIGLTSTNIATASYRKRTFLGFATPMLVPVGLVALLTGDHMTMTLGSFSLALFIASLIAVNKLNKSLSTAIKLSYENQSLIKQLEKEKKQLELSNQRLTQELRNRLSMTKWLATSTEKLSAISSTDISSGNFNDTLNDLWEQAIEAQQPIALVIFELDGGQHWTRGTEQPDPRFQILQEEICCTIRNHDFFIRINEKEFAILLWQMNAKAALSLVNRLRSQLAGGKALVSKETDKPDLTLSWGVAGWVPDVTQDSSELVSASRRAKKIAQREGGNRVSLG